MAKLNDPKLKKLCKAADAKELEAFFKLGAIRIATEEETRLHLAQSARLKVAEQALNDHDDVLYGALRAGAPLDRQGTIMGRSWGGHRRT